MGEEKISILSATGEGDRNQLEKNNEILENVYTEYGSGIFCNQALG